MNEHGLQKASREASQEASRGASREVPQDARAWLAACALVAGCVVDPVPTPADMNTVRPPPTVGAGGGGGSWAPDAGREQEPDEGSSGSKNTRDNDGSFTGLASPASVTSDLFGAVLAGGGVPGPEAVDPLAFFADHTFGAAPCDQGVCLRGGLRSGSETPGAAGCVLAWVGLRSGVSADLPVRPPLHLVVALDAGAGGGAALGPVKAQLTALVKELSPGDRFSLVAFGDVASTLLAAAEVGTAEGNGAILSAIAAVTAKGAHNLYDGLFTALSLASKSASAGESTRVLLLARAAPSAGLTQPSRAVSLVAGWAAQGIATSAVVLGPGVDSWLLRDVAEAGGGHFRVGWPPQRLGPALIAEVRSILLPAAVDLRLEISTGAGWRLAAVRGPRAWSGGPAGGVVRVPLLNVSGVAAGESLPPQPAGTGWRDAGHAIALALRRPEVGAKPGHVLRVKLRWRELGTGAWHDEQLLLAGPGGGGAVPPLYDSGPTAPKAWQVIMLQRVFERATGLAAGAETGTARLVIKAARQGLGAWLLAYPSHALDADLQADLKRLDLFDANIGALSVQTPAGTLPDLCPGQ